MALTRVEITSEVFWTCATHALTTEREEVMGLLLGDVTYGPGAEVVARIWLAMPQTRTDRRKDRVEASPEQLARCSAAAEKFSAHQGTRTRVIGWYHSHPHITVLPSHIDVRTQAMYQMLDEGFVGIIFSTFNEDSADLSQQVQVTAFQSVQQCHSPVNAAAKAFLARTNSDVDSPTAQAIAASQAEADQAAKNGEGNWVRKEVPLTVVQSQGRNERTLTDLVGLLRVLFSEEQTAFRRVVGEATDRDGNIHPLEAINLAASYQQRLCHLMDVVYIKVEGALGQLRMRCDQLSFNSTDY
ncbi:hypothetical protein WJX72_010443 [[Myrmecia] bisecta]|uniref:MPN domain-containing protein n=1 Tax=[Myrmecia] bisecta TaxID=41462 RepID=A0AAW1P229_9CHLO